MYEVCYLSGAWEPFQLTKIVETGSDFDQLNRIHHHWLQSESFVIA